MTAEPIPAPAPEDRHPQESRAARARDDGDAPLPGPRDRRAVLRPDHLHGLPDVLLGGGRRRRSSAVGRRRLRPGEDAEAHRVGHRVGPRLDHRARRLHVRHHRRVADAVAPARPPPGRRRVRPAEPALRQVQGRRRRCSRTRSPRATRSCASATRRRSRARSSCTATCSRPALPGEDARFVFPNATRTNLVMTTNLRALIHMSGPAAVHDGPVGDPPAVPAHPPRDLRGVAVPRLVPRARSACRWATATSSTTATGTARSGRTRTTSSRPGRRRRRPRRPPAGSCRRPRGRGVKAHGDGSRDRCGSSRDPGSRSRSLVRPLEGDGRSRRATSVLIEPNDARAILTSGRSQRDVDRFRAETSNGRDRALAEIDRASDRSRSEVDDRRAAMRHRDPRTPPTTSGDTAAARVAAISARGTPAAAPPSASMSRRCAADTDPKKPSRHRGDALLPRAAATRRR